MTNPQAECGVQLTSMGPLFPSLTHQGSMCQDWGLCTTYIWLYFKLRSLVYTGFWGDGDFWRKMLFFKILSTRFLKKDAVFQDFLNQVLLPGESRCGWQRCWRARFHGEQCALTISPTSIINKYHIVYSFHYKEILLAFFLFLLNFHYKRLC